MIKMTRLVSRPIGAEFFDQRNDTLLTWLGSAGVLINARGTVLLIDPMITMVDKAGRAVIEGWECDLKFELPLHSRDVPRVDVVLYTHVDGDHFAPKTVEILEARLKPRFIAPPPVRARLLEMGVAQERITTAAENDTITVGEVVVQVTPAMHDWKAEDPFKRSDCCGYVVRSADGGIWHPGDTRIIEELLAVRNVDVIFFDLARARAHLGPEGSALIAKTCEARIIVPYHYGTFDVPPGGCFGG